MILLPGLISFNFFTNLKKEKTLTAEELFDQTTHSVVEVKASTEDVGESFGSAVFVCDNGTLVTNALV